MYIIEEIKTYLIGNDNQVRLIGPYFSKFEVLEKTAQF